MPASVMYWMTYFPGDTKDKNMPANAGDMCWIPVSEGLIPLIDYDSCCEATKPIIPQLLNPRSRARKLQLLSLYVATTEACVPSTCAPQREATAMRSPCTTRVVPAHCNYRKHAATMSQCSQKQLKKIMYWMNN